MRHGTALLRPRPGGAADAADPRLPARAFVALWVAAVTLAWIWIALAGRPGHDRSGLIVVAAVATVAAVAAGLGAARLPRSAQPVLLVLVVAVISAAVGLTGGLMSDFSLFYVWAAAWCAAFLDRRAVLACLLLIAVGYAAAVAVHGVAADELRGRLLALWLFRIGTVLAMALLVAALRRAVAHRERTLRRREGQQQAVADLGVLAMATEDPGALAARTVAALRQGLPVPRAAYLEHDIARGRAIPRAVVGWPEVERGLERELGLDSAPPVSDVVAGDASQATADGALAVQVRGREQTYGTLVAVDDPGRRFTREDVDFTLGLAAVLGAALERHAAEEALRQQSMHDPLTGAPNRALFFDRLNHAVARARRSGTRLGVLYLDLDGFKGVNDSLGHQAGDALLVGLAPRLREAVRSSDTVARLGGDEFAILCEDVAGAAEAQEVAARLLAAVQRPVRWGRTGIQVSASVGVAVSELGRVDPDALVRDADAALYRAKARGRGRFELWDDSLRETAEARRRTQVALRRAIDEDELRVVFEPVVELSTEIVVGAEALVRWSDPPGTPIPPRDFLAVAEDGGLMGALSAAVLHRACRAAASWPESTWVAVNIAPRQLLDTDLEATVEAALRRSGLDPARLYLELTETAVLGDADGLEIPLERLKALGVRLVIDDFGTGHASLAHLRRHPIDAVKIDRSFVAPLPDGASERAIVRAVVGLAASLGFELIAEGVEQSAQAAALQLLGCEIAQGWLYGRECTAQDILDLTRMTPGPRFRAAPAR